MRFGSDSLGIETGAAAPIELQPPPVTRARSRDEGKDDSEAAALWFMFAALALPLALGGAPVVGSWVIKDRWEGRKRGWFVIPRCSAVIA